MEYILIILSFFMTCFAINPNTWDKNKTGLIKITFLGGIIILVAFAILISTLAKTNNEKREKIVLQKKLESITEHQLKQLNISLAEVYEVKEIYLPLTICFTRDTSNIIENSQLIDIDGVLSLSKDLIYNENNLHINLDIKAEREKGSFKIKWLIPTERLQIQNIDSFKYLWITLNIKLPIILPKNWAHN